MKHKLHFHRFEFKYIMAPELRKDFEGELGYFMALDPYVEGKKKNKYFVRSLYFDNDSYTNYYEKTDGVMVRRKFRIRTYTDNEDEDCVVFLEVKGRYNSLVFKHRVLMDRVHVDRLGENFGAFEKSYFNGVGDNEVQTRFWFELQRLKLKPKILVDYARRPYISKYAPDFRVTFDDALEVYRSEGLFTRANGRQKKCMPEYSIMEVKFRRHIPAWFHRLIQAYEQTRLSVSKYCVGLEKMGMAVNLE